MSNLPIQKLRDEAPTLSRLAIYCIRDKFETSSSVTNAPKSGRPRTTLTLENEKVALTFVNKEVPATSVLGAGYPEDVITMSDSPTAL
ncbi:hypothetical protein TNCV_2882331 [Trichonephila clavipes]|nr:hypothetical protein TNCV_2882331 [Trichonephila clavipes]